jgi:hypothetical protein
VAHAWKLASQNPGAVNSSAKPVGHAEQQQSHAGDQDGGTDGCLKDRNELRNRYFLHVLYE